MEPEREPGDRRPHRPHRLGALVLGRTETMTTIASVVSSKRTPSTTVRVNPHARCHTLLFCTLFCSLWFRVLRQRETSGADWVQPRQPSPNHPQIQQESDISKPLCVKWLFSGCG